jgi:hypothetical protein
MTAHALILQRTDRLLELPHEGNSDPPTVESLRQVAMLTRQLVKPNWFEGRSWEVIASIKAMACLAVMPTLERIATDAPHDLSVAQEVVDNLQEANKRLLRADILPPKTKYTNPNVKGAISELAILGTLWLMVKHGHLRQDCYVLPTTRREDRATKYEGYRRGVDFVMFRSSDAWVQRRIQAKTNDKWAAQGDYYPGTVMLSVSNLLRNPYEGNPGELLEMVVEEDKGVLSSVSAQAKIRFAQARTLELEYKEAQAS